jgi:hypothetical protein
MTIRNTFAAESWDKVYDAFTQVNFTSYDYDTVKESLIQYLRIYYSESYNDFIESSEMIAVLELFAYVAELLAYRIDTMSHENFISTAQRKASVLRLAKLISYRAARNIPARGLVKINSVKTSQDVFDSLGNNLANTIIQWNDPNNSNWKEQFFLVMERCLTSKFGQPSKSFQINDVLMQLYTFNNTADSFRNGVFSYTATGSGDTVQMEAVPADIDENGPLERAPDLNSQFNIIYASDGRGDGSDYTGFLMFTKQGSLLRTDYTILEPTSNRRIEVDAINVNDTDVWVYRVNDAGTITENWKRVEALNEQNLFFNDDASTRKKFEVETLENDRIALLFGDGNFSDTPVGDYQLWTRVSANTTLTIPKSNISRQPLRFSYTTRENTSHEFNLTFSLTAAIQNNAPSETIEHIRQAAPSTYYAQNRMVNGQDYNTYMLKDSTILRLKTVNRTFAGQPKYIEWNDASQKYENVKLFGDDLRLFLDVGMDIVETRSAAKSIVDSFIEPQLQSNSLLNTFAHILSTSDDSYGIISYPRRKFIEDNRAIYKNIDGQPVNPYGKKIDGSPVVTTPDGSLNEKTAIQSALDRHWYGEPVSYTTINGIRHAVILDPILNPKDDGKLYISDVARTIDGQNTYPPGDVGSGIQQVPAYKYFGLKYNRFLSCFGGGDIELCNPNDSRPLHDPTAPLSVSNQPNYGYGDFNVPPASGLDYYRHKVEVITLEMTSDSTTFVVTSNIRGRLADYSLSLGGRWSEQASVAVPVDFVIHWDPTTQPPFEEGDCFVIDVFFRDNLWGSRARTFGSLNVRKANLLGWWEVIPTDVILGDTSQGGCGMVAQNQTLAPNLVQQMMFEPDSHGNSWIFLISRKDTMAGNTESWSIFNRSIKIIAESPTTKFWFNDDGQIIDNETKKPVYDKIRILRSNLDEMGRPLQRADIYDVVGSVADVEGTVNYNRLEVLPSDSGSSGTAQDGLPDNIIQFENFSSDSYEFYLVDVSNPLNPFIVRTLECDEYGYVSGYDIHPYDVTGYDEGVLTIVPLGEFIFTPGNIISSISTDGQYRIGRRRFCPAPAVSDPITQTWGCNLIKGLDFMWQHWSPATNLIDPSVTNIHDAFILNRGYHSNVMDYVRGATDIIPTPPTPLELRTAYGYLLKNKMLSDTVVLHSGKIKLLFGAKAEQQFRAKFRVVKSLSATFSDERIKAEIISVIDQFFDIQNWDFSDKFFATELISLIHQRLTTQISSVVLVPTYSVNSFGSLFTIDSEFDEILQSAATVNDVEIVDALTPSVLRQSR